jgi:tetratricopeptide (TPR) repeat protein
VAALERVFAAYDRLGRSADAVHAALGLAIAQDDAGDRKTGLTTYAAAAKRAKRIGRPELHSQVLRNWGLALKEAGRPGPAEKRMTEALSEARRGADPEMAGRAAIALGLFLQHEDRLPEARAVIEQGLAVLDPVHPDAIVGRSHRTAVLDGRTCGCGDTPAAMADAFREFVTARIPADLLDRLDVTVEDGDFNIQVALRREPAEGELEQLDTVLRTALTEFRRGLDRSS